MSKIAPQRNTFEAVENDLAAYFRADFGSLFARLTRSPPAHFCPPLSKRSFAYSRLRICPNIHIFTVGSVKGIYHHRRVLTVLRFVPVLPSFVPGLCSVAPQQVRLRQQWKTHCRTAVGVQRCRKEAALTGCSSGGKLAQNATNGDGALLRTNQIKHHKFDFEAHSFLFFFFF